MIIVSTLSDPKVAAWLNDGKVAILPTDTILGIVAKAADRAAVGRLYQAKHREGKPGTLIAADVAQLESLGIRQDHLTLVKDFWPGPISIVLPAGDELAYLHLGKDSLAVRIPANGQMRTLLQQTGPLLTSSANQPGEPPANNLSEAQKYFGDSVDFYVEGDTGGQAPSTVVRLNPDGSLELLRQGAVFIR